MDEAQQYTCPQCGYNCRIGECEEDPDHGHHGVKLATRVCLTCREVIEVITAKLTLETLPNPAAPFGFEAGRLHVVPEKPHCLRCGTEAHTLWDRVRKPCPRCYASMNLTELKVPFRAPDPPIVMELDSDNP